MHTILFTRETVKEIYPKKYILPQDENVPLIFFIIEFEIGLVDKYFFFVNHEYFSSLTSDLKKERVKTGKYLLTWSKSLFRLLIH
jgi:hypothetical protein